MSATLNRNATFYVDVENRQPPSEQDKAAGSQKTPTFRVTFKRLKKTELNELYAKRLADDEFIDETVVKVEGMKDGDRTLESDEAIKEIKDDVALSMSVIHAFADGLAGAGAKNSRLPRVF